MSSDVQYASRGSGTSDEAERTVGVDCARVDDRSLGIQRSQIFGVFVMHEIPRRAQPSHARRHLGKNAGPCGPRWRWPSALRFGVSSHLAYVYGSGWLIKTIRYETEDPCLFLFSCEMLPKRIF